MGGVASLQGRTFSQGAQDTPKGSCSLKLAAVLGPGTGDPWGAGGGAPSASGWKDVFLSPQGCHLEYALLLLLICLCSLHCDLQGSLIFKDPSRLLLVLNSLCRTRGKSTCMHLCMRARSLSCVQLFATPWTAAFQAPLSMEFSRQENWSGLPFPSPGDLPDPGIELSSPALAG